jgi:DNA (cytosine-5)-methyltransferase 1
MEPSPIQYCDLFAGAGGMSLGFEQAGFECVLAVDSEPEMVDTFNYNRETKVARLIDATRVTREYFKNETGLDHVPMLIAGPPCQGFSMAGKRNTYDPRNSMVDQFFQIIDDLRPEYFVMENVPGILSMLRPEGRVSVVDWVSSRAGAMGYKMAWKKLYAHWYGVPQARPRVIFVGWNPETASMPIFPPPITHSNDRMTDLFGHHFKPYMTVGEALKSIPPDAPNQDLVYEFKNSEYIAKVEKLGPGESVYEKRKDSHRRLDPAKPAFVMKGNHGAIAVHPFETRMINLREMSTIQGFPHHYKFLGDKSKIAVMIGNATPVGLAHAVASSIKKAIESIKN